MPRATRHVVNSSPSSPASPAFNDDQAEKALRKRAAQQSTIQSPVRKMRTNAGQRPRRVRDSDVSSILSVDDDISEAASPYTPRAQDDQQPVRKNGKQTANGPMRPKERLQKTAAQNRRISSLQMQLQHTPQQVPLRGDGDDHIMGNLQAVGSSSFTPASKRPVPILANFEDWLKLATDNKINATNSWNFALIDYFHDMSLLFDKDGRGERGVNFQKASCTLDGCVKIYGARVESVSTEAGRLLSGLATNAADESGKKKRRGEGEEEDEDGEDEDAEGDDEEGGSQKKKKDKKKNRSHEATLAPSFASLQLKKLELEFAVDPLFKKASADFDEGGAKGLLLNHLCIDGDGRIVFDSSDDATDDVGPAKNVAEDDGSNEKEDNAADVQSPDQSCTQPKSDEGAMNEPEDEGTIDLASLASKFFPDLSALDDLDICPSMKNFKLGDPSAALSIPFLCGDELKHRKASPEKSQPPPRIDDLNLADQSGLFLDGINGLGFDDDDEGIGGFDMGDNVGFGEGGEVWAKEAAVEPMMRPVRADDDDQNPLDGDGGLEGHGLSLQHRFREDAEQDMMLTFFGKAANSRAKVGTRAFQTLTSSLTNWKIQKIQKQAQAENTPAPRQRKEKEPFVIDFHGPMSENLQKILAAERPENRTITLPRTQEKTKGKNLLDKDDELVDVKAMMRLWTKPKCRVGRRKGGMAVIDEGFGARGREQPRLDDKAGDDDEEDDRRQGDYDANFFADDEPLGLPFDGPLPIDDDDDDVGEQPGFVDAREMLSPPPDGQQLQQNLNDILQGQDEPADPHDLMPTASQADNLLPGSFGSQLVTQQGRRLRPEYVNYARTAKKVDVRALKENMWKGMHPRLDVFSEPAQDRMPTPALTDADGDTDMMEAENEAHEIPDLERVQEQQQQPAQQGEEALKFTDILSSLKNVYPDQQMKDISTSYGFICLLHLANEKGLLLEGGREDGMMNEIMVKRDPKVEEGYVGE